MTTKILKKFFAHIWWLHGFARHFRRIALFEGGLGSTVNREIPIELSKELVVASENTVDALLADLNSNQNGLSKSQAEKIRERIGLNEIAQEKPLTWWHHLWLCYKTPFNILLTVLAMISYFTEDMKATIVISFMIVLSTFIRFLQERKSNLAADQLKAMVTNTVTVLRRDSAEDVIEEALTYFQVYLHPKESQKVEVPIKFIVPGDIIILSAGDMIPADCRILTATDLFVSQSAMTGESLPVEKFAQHNPTEASNPLELDNLLFMGSNVVSGSATAVVVKTGQHTYFGAIAQRVTTTAPVTTQFQVGVNKVAWLLIRFILLMTPLVLLINGFTKHDWVQASLFAMSIAVGLTPELLPMIVTSTLAKGAVMLSRRKVVVKHLDAIQNFGAMDILCADKTGTLTQDKIVLARHVNVWGEESNSVLSYAYLNSYYQTGLKNLLDVAVLQHGEVHRELNPVANYSKVDEIPFDFQRRRMSVIVENPDDQHILISKGAVEEILTACSKVRRGESEVLLNHELLENIRAVTAALNKEGLRVVAVAAKKLPPHKDTYSVADESELTLIGYVAFLDPPKESTALALEALAQYGVNVKVLTGDNDLVTATICRQVGLSFDKILIGNDIERMNDEELAQQVEQHHVFARLTPAHKERIVRLLKQNGHVVGFMGDGINDAAALRTADIGISVDTAVDIAKEAADIILLEKSLMVLKDGVIEGRKTFANMLKYIKMTVSSNFGNVLSVLVASAFLPFLPMLPMHLLLQNLLYDFSQTSIPFDNIDEEAVKQPQRWNPEDIGRFMLFFGPISSIFDIFTFGVMWFVFSANTPAHQTLFQSGWFVEGLMTQILVVHMIRTRKIPFIQSRPGTPLLVMTGLIMATGIFIVMGPFANYFKLQALPLSYFPILVAMLLGYMVLTQLMKHYYSRRYGWH
jgi:Mg2+-importing ATPase